jgi:rRNA maturation RNase YbeY
LKKEQRKLGTLNFIFTNDENILQINKDFLSHDYYTDIITFPMEIPGIPDGGEIYISIDRVADNAQQMGVSFNDELDRVLVHGVLHLCGYKDKTKAQEKEMRAMEEKYLLIRKH